MNVAQLIQSGEARSLAEQIVAGWANPRRRVVQLRYGLADDGDPHSVDSTARFLRLTTEQVELIEETALQQLAEHPQLAELLRQQNPVTAALVIPRAPSRPSGLASGGLSCSSSF